MSGEPAARDGGGDDDDDDDITVIHVDAACVVVVKPGGMLAVPGRGEHLQDCVITRLQVRYADALVVHRLDMSTSGLMVFARGLPMQRRLSLAFEQRTVRKRYVAVVHGHVATARGEIDLPLGADWPNRPKQQVDVVTGKPSLTRYCVTCFDDTHNTTRVVLEPVTGRTHQLRVHMLAIGHPILGDALYAPADVQAMAGRLLLHAEQLSFDHPVSGEPLSFESAAPF